jgi:hypothetical protein
VQDLARQRERDCETLREMKAKESNAKPREKRETILLPSFLCRENIPPNYILKSIS